MEPTKKTFLERVEATHLHKPVSVLCARYWYRGYLAEVGSDYVRLSDARAVETTGSASAPKPTTEDKIPGLLVIREPFIEAVCELGHTGWDLEAEEPAGLRT